MFCGKCGAKIEDGSLFCPNCGEKLIEATQPVAEEPAIVEEPAVVEEPVVENSESASAEVVEEAVANDVEEVPVNFTQPSFETEKPKKKGKKLWIAIGTSVVAIALVVAIVLNLGSVWGGLVKLFGSDGDYYKYVEKKALKDHAGNISETYGDILVDLGEETTAASIDANVELTVGEGTQSLIKEYLGEDVDISALNGLSIALKSAVNEKAQQVQIGLDSKGNRIITLDMILDLISKDAFVAIPELSSKYLYANMEEQGISMSEEDMEVYKDVIAELEELAPDEETLNSILDRYIEIAIDCIDEDKVEETKEKIAVGDIEKKVTALEFSIDEDYAYDVVKAVLMQLKDDKEVEEIVNNIESYLAKEEMIPSDADLWKELKSGIDEVLDNMDKDDMGKFEIVLTTYVNGSHEVIGRALEVEDQKIISYITLKSGKNFATEIDIADKTVQVKGSGTEKNDVINGKYTIKYMKETCATVELVDFNTDVTEKKPMSGSIEIIPSNTLVEEIAGSGAGVLIKPSVKFSFAKDTVNFEVFNSGSLIVGLKLTATVENGADVTVPDKNNAVDASDSEACTEWIKGLDITGLFDKLDTLNLPDYIKEALDNLEEELLYEQENFGNGSSYSDYDYDYDYSYDYDAAGSVY